MPYKPHSDPKRPWLDWRADEVAPLPHAPLQPIASPRKAHIAYFIMLGGGYFIPIHRLYLRDGRGIWKWTLAAFCIELVYLGSLQLSPNLKYAVWAVLGVFSVIMLYKEARTIRPAVEAYNRKLYDP